MLDRPRPPLPPSTAARPSPAVRAPETLISLAAAWRLIARHRLLFACVFLTAVLLGCAYVALAPRRYTATTTLLIDTRSRTPAQQSAAGSAAIESANVDSQVEVLRSESVLRGVVEALDLISDPEFAPEASHLKAWLRSQLPFWSEIDAAPDPTDPIARAIALVDKGLVVKRLGLSYVIQVDVRAASALRAAEIGNAIADVYIGKQVDGRQAVEGEFRTWLERRAGALRETAQQSERDTAQFRLRRRLSDIEARVLGERQLSELGIQLILAQAQRAEAQAKLDRIAEGRAEARDGAMADTLKSEVISRLRAQYLDVVRRGDEWAARMGPANPAAGELAAEKAAIERAIAEELGRMTRAYEGDLEIARAREATLQQSLDRAAARVAQAAQEGVELIELESAAQTNRALAEGFARRLAELAPQSARVASDARVISRALPPREKSEPRTILTLGAALAVGALGGFGAAALRERSLRGLRARAQAEAALGAGCLGTLPRLRPDRRSLLRRTTGGWPFRVAIDRPTSRFAETIRTIKVAADAAGATEPPGIIGVVSALPREGRSVTAANLGHLFAASGMRTLLVDMDLRRRGLTGALMPTARSGTVEVTQSRVPLDDAVWREPASGLAILPAVSEGETIETVNLLSSRIMQDFVEALSQRFEVVILDLPPILPVADVAALAPLIQAYVLVVEWGATEPETVLEAIERVPGLRERLLGVVLNKGDPAELRRDEAARGAHYRRYCASVLS